jgi:hypothetical protein
VKKLTRLGVPTKSGGRWNENTIGNILANEKFIGDMCLQKGFIADHITKHHRKNKGALPKYYVEGSHEAIIDRFPATETTVPIVSPHQSSNSLKGEPRTKFTSV